MPRPDVKAIAALFDGQRLLTQCDRSESLYRLPGGNVELGETAAQALTRELEEEYGLAIVPGALLAIIENRFQTAHGPGHEILLVHHATLATPLDGTRRDPGELR